MDACPTLTLAAWLSLHLAAVAVAWMTRLPLGERAAAFVRGGMAGGFVGVAAIALLTHRCDTLGWAASAGTLGVMTIAAVADLAATADVDPTLARVLADRT